MAFSLCRSLSTPEVMMNGECVVHLVKPESLHEVIETSWTEMSPRSIRGDFFVLRLSDTAALGPQSLDVGSGKGTLA